MFNSVQVICNKTRNQISKLCSFFRASSIKKDVLVEASTPLDQDGIRVIPVAIGKEADAGELSIITPNEGEVIAVPKTEEATSLADKLMSKLLKGMMLFLFRSYIVRSSQFIEQVCH